MDLDFTEEQQMVIDMTRTMLEEHCDSQVVRDAEDDPKGYPDALWKQMSELGLNGLLIPESYGGGEQTILEGAFVYGFQFRSSERREFVAVMEAVSTDLLQFESL